MAKLNANMVVFLEQNSNVLYVKHKKLTDFNLFFHLYRSYSDHVIRKKITKQLFYNNIEVDHVIRKKRTKNHTKNTNFI